MAGLGRWAGFVVGLVVVGATFSSVVGTIVLPKGVRSLISRKANANAATPANPGGRSSTPT